MKYALGNMLNGAGGLNADQLALDLQFAADKTLTARKGPTPVFTRASSGTFVGSNGLIQSAGNNVARFDHDPVTLASRGLLIEESRTNLILQSETLGTTWTQTNVSISSNVTTSPDGSTTADKLVENAVNSGHGIDQSITFTAVAHTFSVYAKASERSWLRMTIASVSNSTWFDVSNGTIGTIGSGVTASIQNAGNGWWRCSVTVTATAGSLQNFIRIATGNNITTYTGDGISGIFIWGAQIEAGSFATSYIPTTTSSVVRSADVCSITGAAFSGMWNASEGSMFINTTRLNTGSSFGGIITASDGTNNNRIYIGNFGSFNSREFAIARLGVGEYSRSSSIASDNRRMVIAYSQASTNSADNSSLGTDDTSSLIPSVNQLVIGANQIVAAIRYYRKRLANAKLQAITV